MIKILEFPSVKYFHGITFQNHSNEITMFNADVPISIPEGSKTFLGYEEEKENLPMFVKLRLHKLKGGE